MARQLVQRPYAAVIRIFEPESTKDTMHDFVTAGYDKDPVCEELMGINIFDYNKSGIPKT